MCESLNLKMVRNISGQDATHQVQDFSRIV